MENYNEFTETVVDYDTHKDIITKWVQVLFICHIATFVASALGMIPAINTIAGWLSRAISIAIIIPLYKLSGVNERYRKASIFYGIAVGGGILTTLLNMTMFAMVLSICSIIANYHELNAHSEITAHKDEKLSKRWHSLFYWELCVGILAAFLGMIPIMIAVFAGADSDAIIQIGTICGIVITLFLDALRILYLKKTLILYRA